jgi:hypothetical protein
MSVDVTPPTVSISGPIDLISKIGSLTLDPAINLTNLTTSQSYVRTIATGSDAIKADPQTAKVNVSVNQVFSCGAPSPAPSPTR